MSEFFVHFLTLTSPVSGRATAFVIARDCDKCSVQQEINEDKHGIPQEVSISRFPVGFVLPLPVYISLLLISWFPPRYVS